MNLNAIPAMLSMIPSVFAGVDVRDLEKIKTIARKAYPLVPQLSTGELAARMEKTDSSVLLVDVRSAKEFAISHLRGAVNLHSAKQIEDAARAAKPAQTILYCAVGFRSSRLAQALADRGLQNVWNLEGSIFQWANEGREVYQGDVPVRQVHPYSSRWAGLLKDGLAKAC